MTQAQLKNTDWFPNYIVVRRKANSAKEGEQWQGLVSEIKTTIIG